MAEKSDQVVQEQIAELCAELGFVLDAEPLRDITGYVNMLQKWNAVMNLVGPRDWQTMVRTLIVDSLHLGRFIPTLDLKAAPDRQHMQTWDLGAGAGIPGMVLRMVWQQGGYHMVDTREKRVMFMRTVLASYPLPDTHVHRARAEDFMAQKGQADLLLSRAFMPWQGVLSFVEGKVHPCGHVLVLANAPAPNHDGADGLQSSALPRPWYLRWQYSYEAAGALRYFWVLSTNSAPN